jgi:hypothetical protein
LKEKIDISNKLAYQRMVDSHPILVDVAPAIACIPGMKKNMFLHGGPPLDWNNMCGPMRGAIIGALMYEERASNPEEAMKVAESGEIEFSSCHNHDAVAPMAGIISPSMPVFVVKNKKFGNKAYCPINEGVGKTKTLRFGAYGEDVLKRLKWIENTFAPILGDAVRDLGGIDTKSIIAEALRRGDECHNRNKSGTAAFFMIIVPPVVRSSHDKDVLASILEFITGNVHFFLNLSMAASKATADAFHGIKYSSVVTAMSTNGTEFGIRVSGLGPASPPYRWFRAPAPLSEGRYFEGFTDEDASPVLGDSYISECVGLGGFAMASAPAITSFVGGSPSWAVKMVQKMSRITVGKHRDFRIPFLDYEGTPAGIDIRKVLKTRTLPLINTGIAHRSPGVGQIGAGLVYAPMECFKKAMMNFKQTYAPSNL